ncbi:polysaccharide export protein [bacterium]|nr:polysaccharide export protein [bacterium]
MTLGTWKRIFPLFALLLVASASILTTGCARTASDPVIGPAIDLSEQSTPESLERLIASAEMQISRGEPYYIGPGDVIAIQLIGREDILTDRDDEPGVEFKVTGYPMLALPLIGAIKVHGKSAEELQQDLRVAYREYISDPQPVVVIKEFNRNKVSVLGSVVKPGRYQIEFGDTLIDAIFKAGGLSMGGRTGGMAPGRYLKLYRQKLSLRQEASMSVDDLVQLISEDGKVLPRDEYVIPIEQFVFHGVLDYNVPLLPNDIIYVPPAGTCMVQGKVWDPGVTFLGPSVMTVTQVIVERGGMRFGGDSDIEVVRSGRDGQPVSYFMNARAMLSRDTEDFALQDGDQVFIYGHPVRMFLEWFAKFFQGSVKAGASATYNPVG